MFGDDEVQTDNSVYLCLDITCLICVCIISPLTAIVRTRAGIQMNDNPTCNT